jgi:hypothetical protein
VLLSEVKANESMQTGVMLASSAVQWSVVEQDSSQQSSGRQECVPTLPKVRDYPQLRSELTDAVMADTSQFCPSLLEKLQPLSILYHAIDLFFPWLG